MTRRWKIYDRFSSSSFHFLFYFIFINYTKKEILFLFLKLNRKKWNEKFCSIFWFDRCSTQTTFGDHQHLSYFLPLKVPLTKRKNFLWAFFFCKNDEKKKKNLQKCESSSEKKYIFLKDFFLRGINSEHEWDFIFQIWLGRGVIVRYLTFFLFI